MAENTKKRKSLRKIKSSIFSRTMSMAKLSLSAGAQMAGQGITSILKETSKKKLDWNTFLKNQARSFSQEVGELKGSLMKAGQMLSMYGEHFFPEEINQFLKTLQQDSAALEWPAMEKILLKELGSEKLQDLEIETEALACASLGQVHRARVKSSGELIALKIQYPNVDKAIDSDLRAIKTFLSLLKILPKNINLDPIFDEIREMLIQETDYIAEAEHTEIFRKKLEGDNRFVVPKVIKEFSNKKILATSYERGLRVDDPVIQSLSQARRNSLGLHFLELYFMELFIWKAMQTDPHFGNYRIRIDPTGHDQIILFDFGATRNFSSDFIQTYHLMIQGAIFNDRRKLYDAAQKLKFIHKSDPTELVKTFEEFCLETIEPFLSPDDPRNKGQINPDGTYDWKNTDLPQRLSQKVFSLIKEFSWRTPPREILFLDRKTGGVFLFLSLLQARVKSHDLLLKYLERSKV